MTTTGPPNGFQSLDQGEYYIDSGDLCVIAEKTRFKFHSFFLTRESRAFREQLGEPQTPESPTERSTLRTNTLVLDDTVRARHFASLLSVFYPERYMYEKPAEEWAIILGLAMKWGLDQVKELCIRELSKDNVPVATRLAIFEENRIEPKIIRLLYANLCASELPLSFAEMERLGIKATYIITTARERLRSSGEGGRSPLSPDRRGDIGPTLRSILESITPTTPSSSSSSSAQQASATQGTSGTAQPTTTDPASKNGAGAQSQIGGTGRKTSTTNGAGGGGSHRSNGQANT